jgi:N-acetylmuramoyl-L-alanine amidase
MTIVEAPSPNFDARPPGTSIDILVLHYTGMRSAQAALSRLLDPAAAVSAHYLVDEDGTIVRLVAERHRAWHAGRAFWRGRTDVNARSIGIELVNPGHEFGYRRFPERQMAAAVDLARTVVRRHRIPARNVVGHSDVAPARKTDPGELFDWQRLAAAGIGLWPAEVERGPASPDEVSSMLAAFGYDTGDPALAVTAFQRHFRPAEVDGRMDLETVRRLAGLLALCGESPAPLNGKR